MSKECLLFQTVAFLVQKMVIRLEFVDLGGVIVYYALCGNQAAEHNTASMNPHRRRLGRRNPLAW